MADANTPADATQPQSGAAPEDPSEIDWDFASRIRGLATKLDGDMPNGKNLHKLLVDWGYASRLPGRQDT
jgi:hypothetical protein